jgi:hypothetical protein
MEFRGQTPRTKATVPFLLDPRMVRSSQLEGQLQGGH